MVELSKKRSGTQRIVTSIKIKPEVWKKAKITAIELDMDACQLVEEAIEEYIKNVAVKKKMETRR